MHYFREQIKTLICEFSKVPIRPQTYCIHPVLTSFPGVSCLSPCCAPLQIPPPPFPLPVLTHCCSLESLLGLFSLYILPQDLLFHFRAFDHCLHFDLDHSSELQTCTSRCLLNISTRMSRRHLKSNLSNAKLVIIPTPSNDSSIHAVAQARNVFFPFPLPVYQSTRD